MGNFIRSTVTSGYVSGHSHTLGVTMVRILVLALLLGACTNEPQRRRREPVREEPTPAPAPVVVKIEPEPEFIPENRNWYIGCYDHGQLIIEEFAVDRPTQQGEHWFFTNAETNFPIEVSGGTCVIRKQGK